MSARRLHERYVGPSAVLGRVLCWTERCVGPSTVLGWLIDLTATWGQKEMEAQRAEATWPRSPSEEVSDLRSFFSLTTTRPGIHTRIFDTDPREQCVNDVNQELKGSFKKKISFALFTSHFKWQKHSPHPKRHLHGIRKNVFTCHL